MHRVLHVCVRTKHFVRLSLIWRHCVAFVLGLVLFVCVPVQGPGGSALRIVFAWRI
jgi:hypothetical protein